MKIFIAAKPKAKENKIQKIDETHYRVFVKALPDEGRANEAILEVLAEYFRLPKIRLTLLSGHHSKNKIVGLR